MHKKCIICENNFKTKPSHFEKRKCCSMECRKLYFQQILIGSNNPNFKNAGIKACLRCNKEYKSYNKKRKYCSDECANKSNNKGKGDKVCTTCGGKFISYGKNINCQKCILIKKENRLKENKAKQIKPLKISGDKQIPYEKRERIYACTECGDDFSKNGRVRAKNSICLKCRKKNYQDVKCKYCEGIFHTYILHKKTCCSDECRKNFRKVRYSSNNNPNYKDGRKTIASMIRDSEKNKKLIKEILQRDKYTCKQCGKVGGRLEVDHIVKFSIIYDEFTKIVKPEHTKKDVFDSAMNYSEFWDKKNLQVLCKKCNFQKEIKWRMDTKYYKTSEWKETPSIKDVEEKLSNLLKA